MESLLQLVVSVLSISIAYLYSKNQHQYILAYHRFNIENYFWRPQVCLTAPIWMDWIKWMHLRMPNDKQKINFIPRFILFCCFEFLWTRLTTPTWHDWKNLLLLLIPFHMQLTNFIFELILETKPYQFGHVHSCPTTPTWSNQLRFVAFTELYLHLKIQINTSTCLYNIVA